MHNSIKFYKAGSKAGWNEKHTCSKSISPRLITNGIDMAKYIDFQDLKKVESKNQEREVLPYIDTFNPRNAEIFHHIYKN